MKKRLGLIGFPIEHSFSPSFFRNKFELEGLCDWTYDLFPLPSIALLPAFLKECSHLVGFNVTIPHKQSILPYLDHIHHDAFTVGAVNTVSISDRGLIGYNTDINSFYEVLTGLKDIGRVQRALVLGTGGASKAVCFVLSKLGIHWSSVSRSYSHGQFTYADLTKPIMSDHNLIIQTTPLGMYPHVDTFPHIPYDAINDRHILVDLIYNPEETIFLREGKKRGASTCNGLEMLYLQAEKSWQIWTNPNENQY